MSSTEEKQARRREYQREYRETNRERDRDRNREQSRERVRRWRKANPEVAKARAREFYAASPKRALALENTRLRRKAKPRATKNLPRAELTPEELAIERARDKTKYRGTCSKCGKRVALSKSNRAEITCRDCRRGMAVAEFLPKACEQCGKTYTPRFKKAKNRAPQRFCSASCRSTWINLNVTHSSKPQLTPQQKRDRDKSRALARSRKRQAMLNAAPWDGVTDWAIKERDKWMCRMPICLFGSRRIYRSRKNPDPRSSSVDHILPLSLGGDDTQWNKRAAHLGCNMARSNDPDDQMLLPFGADPDGALRWHQPKRTRTCGVCCEPLPKGKTTCDLHMSVWFIACATCGRPVTCHGRVRRRFYCSRPECRRSGAVQSHVSRIKQRPAHLRGLEAQSMHDEGMTWDEIADRLGYSRGTSAATAAARATGQRSKTRTIPYERQPRLEQTIRTAGGKYAG